MNVAIVKYGAGNVRSVVNALRRVGVEPVLTDNADLLRRADRVVFPGQGEARQAMGYLQERGLDAVIKSLTQPVLGICIGQQLLCRHSEEGNVDCLGIFDADVVRFQPTRHEEKAASKREPSSLLERPSGSWLGVAKVPHMGWNTITLDKAEGHRDTVSVPRASIAGILSDVDGQHVYYVHSYYVPVCNETIATTDYIVPFSAAMHKDNFWSTQFHPEKSGTVGETILKNFLSL